MKQLTKNQDDATFQEAVQNQNEPQLRDENAFFFFFNDTAPTEIYPLSLHDALPISGAAVAAMHRLSALSRAIPYYEPNSRRTLGIYCLVLVLCVAIKGLLSFGARWKLIGVSRDIEYDIRSDLLVRLLALEPEFYVRNRTGELMSRATNDLNSVRMVLGPGIMYSATTLVTMIMAILVMVTISPSLTLWVLLPAPIVAVAVWYFGKTIHELYEKIQAALATLTARVQENLAGVRIVRAYAQEEAEIQAFDEPNREYVSRNIRLIRTWSMFMPSLTALSGTSFLVLLWQGGRSEEHTSELQSRLHLLSRLL